eukprot:TRINITY_DN156_c0_g1_i2.p1 TRINITY_DN156_c0_g1~~TRINITY_DN156_c0_g1_i2.p1  ORF type:complete len:202 (-),score=45.45 TRINITY_DN156_c0_g1_i2:159-764(-)
MNPSNTERRNRRKRRKAAEVERNWPCSYPDCPKRYGSREALCLHLKRRHPDFHSGRKTSNSNMKAAFHSAKASTNNPVPFIPAEPSLSGPSTTFSSQEIPNSRASLNNHLNTALTTPNTVSERNFPNDWSHQEELSSWALASLQNRPMIKVMKNFEPLRSQAPISQTHTASLPSFKTLLEELNISNVEPPKKRTWFTAKHL